MHTICRMLAKISGLSVTRIVRVFLPRLNDLTSLRMPVELKQETESPKGTGN